jgi:hypothetical protein
MELFKPPPIVKNAKRELRDRLVGAAGNCTGVGMHSFADRGVDLYETPPEAVRALLDAESITGPVWECAAGRGAIVRSIVTNPPYQRAGEFVRHALTLVPHVVMLVRLAFLESQRRADVLDDGRLARVYPFANRLPMMHRDGWQGPKASNSIAHAWLVWDANHRGPWTGKRIAWRPA